MCVFEYIYFARPDSVLDGCNVHAARARAGAFLALEHPAQADVVIGVPDSGIDAAVGYSHQSGIPYAVGLIKNRYIARTFIAPGQSARQDKVKIKLNPIAEVVRGKRVVLIDDSIVRGTTCARIISSCGTPAPRRSTCASPRRPLSTPATTARHRLAGSPHRLPPTRGGDCEDHRRRLPGLFEPGTAPTALQRHGPPRASAPPASATPTPPPPPRPPTKTALKRKSPRNKEAPMNNQSYSDAYAKAGVDITAATRPWNS